jgi:hypothetical protein
MKAVMTTDRPVPPTPPPGAPAASGAPALDRPPVPRPKVSRGAIALAVIGALGVGGYSGIAYSDYELGSPARDEIPASVRSSPGGYRSFHFWHTGYHGGK